MPIFAKAGIARRHFPTAEPTAAAHSLRLEPDVTPSNRTARRLPLEVPLPATTPTSGLRVQLCGDAHLANFGVSASPDRTHVFDLNAFDETLPVANRHQVGNAGTWV